MAYMEYMEEWNYVTSMHAIVNKLPYKLRERWRSSAFSMQEKDTQTQKGI